MLETITTPNRFHRSLAPSPIVVLAFLLAGLIFMQYGTGCAHRQIILSAEDTAMFAPPPQGFDKKRQDILRGKLDSVQYYSKSVGSKRNLLIYTPPGYSIGDKYPVLYLLHGIAGDEKEWYHSSSPDIVLDNLLNDRKIQPMIVVFPNGRAMKNDKAGGNAFNRLKVQAFSNFEKDLLHDVIPFIEANYSASNDRECRALAGISMGGGQALKFGLHNLDLFAWVGGFSSAGTPTPAEIVPDPVETSKKIRLLYISCGSKDDLIFVTQDFHAYLKDKNVPHVYQINPGKHDFTVWINDFYFFSQLIFKN